jgi:tRNA A37 threonylcarbamoyladenosine modification protein TsaB
MKSVLFLQTALSFFEVDYIKGGECVSYGKHPGNSGYNDIFSFLPPQETVLDAVYVCEGPGKHISLRTGDLIAKGYEYLKKIPRVSYSLHEYLSHHADFFHIPHTHTVFQNQYATIFVNGKEEVFQDAVKTSGVFFGEIKKPETLPKHISFVPFVSSAEAVKDFLQNLLKN